MWFVVEVPVFMSYVRQTEHEIMNYEPWPCDLLCVFWVSCWHFGFPTVKFLGKIGVGVWDFSS